MKTRLVVAALVLLLPGCAGSDPNGSKPTFGGDMAATPDAAELAVAKQRAGIEPCPAAEATAPGDRGLPDLTLECLGGGAPVRLAGLAGTPTVINLWASWCGPCREELPLFARAHEAYGDRLRFIGIDFADSAPDAALDLARESGVTYPLLSDPDSTTKAPLRVVGLPQTIFVDPQGRMVATERIEFRSYAELTAAIDRHLGVEP
ncbi:TlpA family protein disulfide reductase [Aeromicrobium sp.]|uniref:TlpA family protein disulfide reductase n=1 Tax=Aeromicrobium sp. TaxID=1871063 RepID=UPI003C4AED3F